MSLHLPSPVALSLTALGATGEAWLAELPGLLAGLAADWSITVGAPLHGGRTAYVAEAATRDGTPAVLKVFLPPGADEVTPFDRQLTALQLAGGDPYAGLIRHDRPRRALLLERLGPPMAALNWSESRQLDALTRTAARGWRPVPDDVRLPPGTEAARWHAGFIPAVWEELARPCSAAAVDLAVDYAARREAAARRGAGVLVHGDVHAFNALQHPGADRLDFRLVDPSGLLSEPAHDLGVIQARGVPGRLGTLATGGPGRMAAGCRRAGRLTGVDPEAVRQWAFIEMVSTGLHLRRLGDQDADRFLAVADELAAARPASRPARRRAGALYLMVGLPGAGKTTRAEEIAVAHRALRLTPDDWMISLFDGTQPDGKRDVLEGHLITLALRTLRLGTSVVLDFGLWSRDERSALRWLAARDGSACHVVHLPVDRDVQVARIAQRQAAAPHTTFPMTEAEIDRWRPAFEAPDAAELAGDIIPGPPPGWASWPEWAADRWPSM